MTVKSLLAKHLAEQTTTCIFQLCARYQQCRDFWLPTNCLEFFAAEPENFDIDASKVVDYLRGWKVVFVFVCRARIHAVQFKIFDCVATLIYLPLDQDKDYQLAFSLKRWYHWSYSKDRQKVEEQLLSRTKINSTITRSKFKPFAISNTFAPPQFKLFHQFIVSFYVQIGAVNPISHSTLKRLFTTSNITISTVGVCRKPKCNGNRDSKKASNKLKWFSHQKHIRNPLKTVSWRFFVRVWQHTNCPIE